MHPPSRRTSGHALANRPRALSRRLLRYGAFVAILGIGALPARAQTFVNTYRLSRGEQPLDLVAMDDGSSISVGLFNRDITLHATLMRVDRLGNEIWHEEYARGEVDFLYAAVSVGGLVVAAGETDSSPWILAVDPVDGSVVWEKTVSGGGRFNSVTASSSGRLVAIGNTSFSSPTDGLVVEFDLAGNVVDSITVGFADDNEILSDGVFDEDGSLTLAGNTNHFSGNERLLWAVHLDDRLRLVWSRATFASSGSAGSNVAIDRTLDGNLVAVSLDVTGTRSDFFVTRIDAADGEVFAFDAHNLGFDFANDVRATQDGGYVVIGTTNDTSFGPRDVWLLGVDSSNTVEWERRLDFGGDEYGQSVEVTPMRGLLTAAAVEHSTRPGHVSLWLQRLESDGTVETSCAPLSEVSSNMTSISFRNHGSLPVVVTAGRTASDFGGGTSSKSASIATACESCSTSPYAFGTGLAGSGGFVPILRGDRGACDGSRPRKTYIEKGLGAAFSVLFLNVRQAELNLFGGTLYVDPLGWTSIPVLLGGPPGVPGAGSRTLSANNDISAFLGVSVFLQVLVADPAAPRGAAFTNGVELTIGN